MIALAPGVLDGMNMMMPFSLSVCTLVFPSVSTPVFLHVSTPESPISHSV